MVISVGFVGLVLTIFKEKSMKVFKLFQIQPTREQYDRVNELGCWTKAFEEMPIIEASQALRMGGSEAYVTDYDKYFTHVADIECEAVSVDEALEEAFNIHNMQKEESIKRYGSQHSMSVGDVLVGEFGDVHIVDKFGFVQLMSSSVGS